MNAILKYSRLHYNLEYYSLLFASVVSLVFVVAYIYLLSFSVIHVVMGREAEEKTNLVQSEIASLEAEYMQLQHKISGEIVTQSGYVKVVDKVFLQKGQVDLVTRR